MTTKEEVTKAVQYIEDLQVTNKELFDKIKNTPEDLKKKGINPPSWLATEFVIIETVKNPSAKSHKSFVVPIESYVKYAETSFLEIIPDKKYNAVIMVTA